MPITINIVSISFPVCIRLIPPNVAVMSIYPMAIAKDEFFVRLRY